MDFFIEVTKSVSELTSSQFPVSLEFKLVFFFESHNFAIFMEHITKTCNSWIDYQQKLLIILKDWVGLEEMKMKIIQDMILR